MILSCRILRQLGGIFDYTVTAELTGDISPVSAKKENISVRTLGGKTVKTEKSVYNLADNTVTLTLAPQYSYDDEYSITIADEEYICRLNASAPAKANEISIKNVTVSNGEATVYVYNPTFSAADAEVTATTDGGVFTQSLTIEAESVGMCTVSGENLESAQWTVGVK